MPSATTADSNDSMAPSNANAIASGNTARAFSSENSGHAGQGNCRGMPPKRVPTVSTGSDNAHVANAATTTAIRMPGQAGRSFRRKMMIAMLTAARATAEKLAVPSPPANASSFGRNSPGSFVASVIPSRSLSWLAKIMTAIPAVNPTVTG
jgi:hypothetical protein